MEKAEVLLYFVKSTLLLLSGLALLLIWISKYMISLNSNQKRDKACDRPAETDQFKQGGNGANKPASSKQLLQIATQTFSFFHQEKL